MQDWVSLLSVGTNISILLVGLKLVRHMTRIEFQVEMMWKVFSRRYGERQEKGEEFI